MAYKDKLNAERYSKNYQASNIENKIDETKNGYVDHYRQAYTNLPSLEQAQKRVGVYKVLRIVLLVVGILFTIAPIVVSLIALRTFDEYSQTQSIILAICLFVFVLGIVSLFFCRAVYIDYGKCQTVILSQNDNSETVKE